MSNIPGVLGYTQPNVYSRVRTTQRAVSIPGGLRTLAIIGLGYAQETTVLNANGAGKDGLNPTFATTVGQDGRHFQLAQYPLVPKRTTILLNGIPLTGTEGAMVLEYTSDKYQYILELHALYAMLFQDR